MQPHSGHKTGSEEVKTTKMAPTEEAAGEMETRFIKGPQEETGKLKLIFEIIKAIFDVNLIILIAIFRFFVPVKKKDLKGEIVVITGAAGFIGRLLALRFAKQGIINTA